MDDFETYREAARRAGVPEEAVDLARRLARPQIELTSVDEGGGVPVGRYGGLPRLPRGAEWDGYPDLVASIDCAALPQGALDFPLPRDGHLLFFADKREDSGSWGEEDPPSVVHVPAGSDAAERSPAGGGAVSEEPRPLYARTVWSLPTDADDAVLADEEVRRVYTGHRLEEHGDGKKRVWEVDLLLGGYGYSPQDPPPTTPGPGEEEKGEWILLAQGQYPFRDDPDSTGCPFWTIQRADLEAMDFAKARLVMWSYH
ncbi:DUF1963 domain-containing protein [Nocardiopsis sp. CNT-189]|uniref:DUF1963 domain-containing protein n=1 Tax=Nocardiopsis oceanisediminis TaxID=2816862 RepID=UPI003B3ACF13